MHHVEPALLEERVGCLLGLGGAVECRVAQHAHVEVGVAQPGHRVVSGLNGAKHHLKKEGGAITLLSGG